ncbi:MAG TPA: polyhydroxyalkanoate synthesis repressor PhaR [Gammaproteobacteria bacterium]|jgi:polyhydroxyalkanoate synthesis repressor PhaR
MADGRVIKKYPNRRLYDTQESRYITLNDIWRLVIDHHTFDVIDKKNGENITCSVLLQVMVEQVQSGQGLISREVLAQMIRVHSGELPGYLRHYLQESLSLFVMQQRRLDELLDGGLAADSVNALTDMAQQNLSQWIDLNKRLLRAVAPAESVESETPRVLAQA